MQICLRRWVSALLLTAGGCDSQPDGQESATAGPVTNSTSSSGSTGDAGSDGTSGGPSGTSEPEPDADPTEGTTQCDVWQQDCPEGQKCVPYAEGGGPDLHSTKCVPIDEPAQQAGELCVAEGGFGSGDDACDEGLLCWPQGPMDHGVCVSLCAGSPADPQCPEGQVCAHGIGEELWVCVTQCDPLANNCLEGTNCVATDSSFGCALDISGDEGQLYDACQYANACDPGLMCGPPQAAPGCGPSEVLGCCLPFCEVSGTSCPDGLECAALYDQAEFPEFAAYGICVAPP